LTSFDAKKFLPAQPLEPWQLPDQGITLAASRKGSFDSHVSAEKGPEAHFWTRMPTIYHVCHCSGCHVNRVRV